MLKNFGSIYTNNKEDMKVIAKALENDGFQIAYTNDTNATIIKEVSDLNEEPQIAG